MNSLRKFAYAAVLTLGALSFTPSPASAQHMGGAFTLGHAVHWQSNLVPAGEYRFSIEADGPAELLLLRRVGGNAASFMMLVTDINDSKPSDLSRLVMVSRPSGSFVKQMQLPEFGVTLHFAVPADTREVAQATPAASAFR